MTVGDKGTLLHDIGLGWETKLSNDLELRGVHAVSLRHQNEAWAVGDEGLLLHWAAQSSGGGSSGTGKWTRKDLPHGLDADLDLTAVWVEPGEESLGRGLIAGREALLVDDGAIVAQTDDISTASGAFQPFLDAVADGPSVGEA